MMEILRGLSKGEVSLIVFGGLVFFWGGRSYGGLVSCGKEIVGW